MKRKTLLLIALTVLTTIVVYFVASKREGGLVGPGFMGLPKQSSSIQTPAPIPVPTPNAPKTFKFDASTDLKMELDKVNPQVLDSDFE